MKFNKIKLIAGLCLAFGVSSFGQNNVGTLVTDPVRPFSVSSTHPSAIANEIKGGPFTSSNLAGLSNIPTPRLELGAIGYATNTGLYYRLTATNPATWSSIDGINITNLNASNITGSIPFLNISNALTNANVAFGTATFNNAVQGPLGVATNPAFRFGTNQSGFYYGNQVGFGQSVAVSIFGSYVARFQSNRVVFDQPIDFLSPTSGSALTTRTNLGIQDFVTNPVVQVVSGGTGATNAGGARTNLGLGATNNVSFLSVTASEVKGLGLGFRVIDLENTALTFSTNYILEWSTNSVQVNRPLVFFGTNVANESRTNLGLGGTNSAFSSLSVGQLITNQASASNASSAFGRQISVGSTVENSFAAGFGLTMTNSGQAGGSILLGGMGTMAHWGAFLFNGVPQGGVAATSRGNSTFAVNASNGIYLNGPMYFEGVSSIGNGLLRIGSGGAVARAITNVSTGQVSFLAYDGNPDPSVAWTAFTPAQARTNLGLAWSALTNSNAGTGLVSVDTNGDVVSPTNFWQRAPIQTTVQDFTGITVSQTNNATNARNVYVYSLATNVSGISNTIILPTNVSTFNGDEVTVVHKGTTNTTTVVRQAGSTNNLITLNKFDESVKFIRELGQWDFYHNISFVEPIQFSGTNVSANAAVSRTNLGLGATNNVYFQSVIFGTNVASSVAVIDNFGLSIDSDDTNTSVAAISFIGAGADMIAASTRTNLGLGLSALTNTSNTTFQQAIFTTNAAPTNTANVNGIGFNTAIAWMAVNIVTNGVTNTFHVPLFK